jgi:acetolactate synthase-1/2/3 large subunit
MNTVWTVAARVLADAGISHVFGLPADEPGLLDAAADHPELRCVPIRDQRVGACAAAGFTAATGVPAVLALTSGPAFTNALTGLLEAASLGLPMVVVTTRIPGAELGRGGFQEVDQAAMAGPLVKWYHRVERADRLAWALRRAVHLAVNGRPGITLVEVTDEVHRGDPPACTPVGPVRRLRTLPPVEDLVVAAEVLSAARRPILLAGGGARAAGAGRVLARLAGLLGAPVLTTASGRGIVDEDAVWSFGVAGLYLTPPLQDVVDDADVVCVIGSRLEETVRMGWASLAGRRIVQIDADVAAFGQAVTAGVALLGDAALTTTALADLVAGRHQPDRRAWRERATAARAAALGTGSGSAVCAVFAAVTEVFGPRVTLVQENGLHDMWGYHFSALRVRTGTVVVGPGEQTMMGYGLPAAIGVALGTTDRPTVLLCGDGALGISMAALPTAAELGLGLVAVMFDNGGFGWPRRGRTSDGADDGLTRFALPSPVAAAVLALGGEAFTIGPGQDPAGVLKSAQAVAAEGRLALVTVPVADDDVPAGVLRLEALS